MSMHSNTTIFIARGVMEKLCAEGKRNLAKGSERVWNDLVTARNSAQDFEINVINLPIAKKNDAHQYERQTR